MSEYVCMECGGEGTDPACIGCGEYTPSHCPYCDVNRDWADGAEQRFDALIAELRELHKQRTPDWPCPDIGCNCTEPFCWDCGEVWPCRTIKTLDRYDTETQ